MTNENKLNLIIEQIDNLSSDDLMRLNNDFCEKNSYNDNHIYSNDEEFFQMFFENDLIGAVRAVSYGQFSYRDDYVKFNGYGNLESFSSLNSEDLAETPEIIAQYAIDNDDDFDGLLDL